MAAKAGDRTSDVQPSTGAAPISRATLLGWLAEASISGYVGLFVGTGFSRAVAGPPALSFEELLTRLAERLKLSRDFQTDPRYRLKSLPQIASCLLADYHTLHPPKAQGAQRFKETIAQLCNVMPIAATQPQFTALLAGVQPSWIITTNYDLILEALIPSAESILPTAPLVPRPDRVPIYHIHGHRHAPDSIMITEEDYVRLLGRIDYPRLKLPLLLLESATLMLGYALGDINVRAAMEWARSFHNDADLQRPAFQGVVIQALYSTSPRAEPYQGPHGEYVLETSAITDLLAEIGAMRANRLIALKKAKAAVEGFLADPANAVRVAEDKPTRTAFLTIVREALPFAEPTRVIEFLAGALDPIWERASADGGFPYYDVYLALLIDILAQIDYRRTNPVLIAYLGDALERVGWYIDEKDTKFGTAWAASRRWRKEHVRIPAELKDELASYARTYGRIVLRRVLAIAR